MKSVELNINAEGDLILPPDLAKRLGWAPGETLRLDWNGDTATLSRGVDHLAKVYIEPTDRCNLNCRTCMRNVWDEPMGMMSPETFERVLASLADFDSPPLVFFGGFGEPLLHPHILEMVTAVRKLNCPVELITNGILLDETKAHELVNAGLNRLWVSLDGASPESYADVRLGAALPQVIANLKRFSDLRQNAPTRLGVAFVAMRRNIGDLPRVISLGKELGADMFSISNVLAHTDELCGQMLYVRSMGDSLLQPGGGHPMVNLPRMDVNEETLPALTAALQSGCNLHFSGSDWSSSANRCPFIEAGSTAIRWDGAVSPCLPLLHTHTGYLETRPRTSMAFAVGNLAQNKLREIWLEPDYHDLRLRLRAFDFSPCTFCNACELADRNEEECFGNTLPACGGCLWAQGFIRCP
ncbi:MAG: radical SAM protein [Anaerolineaceae bacterium]